MGKRSARRKRSHGGKRRVRRGRQLTIDHARRGRGGPRPGAGRPRRPGRRPVPHRRRPTVRGDRPQHVTTRILGGLPSLRTNKAFAAIRRSIARGHKEGFRVVHFSVMGNHLHLLVEALGKEALAAGMKGLKVRIARALNRTWRRKGTVFAERYHARELSTPRETRHGLSYCLNNYRRHERQAGRTMPDGWLDPRSSARQFDGWDRDVATEPGVVVRAETWLLRSGWRRAGGALDPNVVPGPGPG